MVKVMNDEQLVGVEARDDSDRLLEEAGPIAFTALVAFIIFGTLVHFDVFPTRPFMAYSAALLPVGALFLLKADTVRGLTISVPPILLGVWIFLSKSWSEDVERTTFLTQVEVPLLIGFMVVGAVLSERRIMTWMWRAGQLALGISVVATIAIPSSRAGVLLNGERLDGWHALFRHKNSLGPFLAMLVGLVLVVDRRPSSRWPTLGIIAVMLLGSQSITGITSALVGGATYAWLSANRRADDRSLSIAVALTTTLAVAGALGLRAGLSLLLQATGKDPTLSGRTEIWSSVWGAIGDRPLLGYGRGGLFFSPPNEISLELWREIGFRAPHAHNGVLDIASQLGLIGLVLFATIFLSTLRSAARSYRRGETFGSFTLVYMAIVTVTSLSEPVFLGPYLSVLVMLRIVHIRLDRASRLDDLASIASPKPALGTGTSA